MTNTTNQSTAALTDVNITAMTDIHGLKGSHGDPFIWWALAITTVVLAALLFWLLRRTRAEKAAATIPQETAQERAHRELAALEARLAADGASAVFFVSLSAVLRRYIEGRFSVRAQEMTSEEFIAFTKEATFVSGKQKNELKEFFSLADLIKFAKHAVTPQDARASLSSVRGFVDETVPLEEKKPDEDL